MAFCNKGLHPRVPGKGCQECRRDFYRTRFQGLCGKGHPKTPGKNCKQCSAEYMVRWREEHHESENAKALANYYRRKAAGLIDQQSSNERTAEWRKANPERYREHNARYYETHREEHRARVEAWREANPERSNEIGRNAANRRHARKKGALGSHTESEWQAVIERQRGLCAYCGRGDRPLTKDHVVPLSKGGCDMIFNIVAACKPCNSRKRALLAKETHYSLFDKVGE